MNEVDLFFKTFSGGLKAVSKGIYSFSEMLDRMNEMSDETTGEKQEEKPAQTSPAQPEISGETSKEEEKQKEKRPVGRPRKSPGPTKKKKKSAIDGVYDVIKRSKADGISLDEISKKTGFDKAKINNIIYRLKEQKKIIAESRGTYRKTTRAEKKQMAAEEAPAGNAPVAFETAEAEAVESEEERAEIEPPTVEPEIEPEEAKEE